MWKKLESAGVPEDVICLLRYWYVNQINAVRWGDALSYDYSLSCGVRQGGSTSLDLFNLYVNDLIVELSNAKVGCHLRGVCANNVSYAEDMALLSPCVGLGKLLICERYADEHGLTCNVKKTEVMVFKHGGELDNVPDVILCGSPFRTVTRFKYLGHILTRTWNDRGGCSPLEVTCWLGGSRTVRWRSVSCLLSAFYTNQLWSHYTQRTYNALRVQYNNALRCVLRLPWRCSASGMFAEHRLDDFHAIVRK